MKKPHLADTQSIWISFAREASLTDMQQDLFKQYCALIRTWNKTINLTAITHEQDIIDYHFKDALQVHAIIDMNTITHTADIGTGAGLPGIPLVIKYPHLTATLIEVNTKKIQFLDTVITELGLSQRVRVFDEDWRTFLRTTNEAIQLFCARASLQPEELIRVFKPTSPYNQAQLIYWASALWQPSKLVAPYVIKDVSYMIRSKKRRLILLQNKQ